MPCLGHRQMYISSTLCVKLLIHIHDDVHMVKFKVKVVAYLDPGTVEICFRTFFS